MRVIIYWLIDYIYLFKGSLQMYLNSKPPKFYLENAKKGKCPILLLSGITLRWGFLKHLGDKISLVGHPVYVVPELGFGFLDIPKSAKIIKKIIEENDLKKVIIVAHSKGGLIGKYLLIHKNNDNRIKGLIAVATPFSGSKLSGLIPCIAALRELLPESEAIKTLKSNGSVNAKIISIFPTFDNHVWSEEGSYLKGATNIEVNVKGHHKILFTKEAEEKIMHSIKKLST